MKYRLAQPDILIDISGISPDPIQLTDTTATIHALTTHATIEHHEELTRTFDVIADGIPRLADPQVRNLGTIGGGLAHADPSNDWGPMLTAIDAVITTITPDSTNEYSIHEFFNGPFTPVLDHAELIESITIPLPESYTGGAYLKASRRDGVYGMATAGAQVTLNPDGTCESIGICCADDVSTYVSPQECVSLLKNTPLNETVLADATELIKQDANPVGDSRGSADYKRSLCGELFKGAVTVARERAQGNTVPDPMNPPRP
jgi:carbon-monoxide dehydrogenase medium subunit